MVTETNDKENKWGIKGIIPPTKKGLERDKKEALSKERGEKLSQRKKDSGLEECFWTVGNTSPHIDDEHIDEMDDL